MRRRDMLAAAALSGLVPLRRGLAQDRRLPRIGWLRIQAREEGPGWLSAFRAGLAENGLAEGRSYQLVERYADGAAARLPALAEELVQAHCAVILGTSQPAVDALSRATRSIPIVGRMTDDPVPAGLARSLARPGGNVTGVYSQLEETNAKRLALLRQAVPGLRRVGALLTLDRGATRHWLDQAEAAAGQMGLGLEVMDVRGPNDLEPAFAAARRAGAGGVLAFRNPTIVTHAAAVIRLSDAHRLPIILDDRDYVVAGALMSYGPNLGDIFRRLGLYAARLLRGEPVGEMPVQQPLAFELVINARTARAMGLALPPDLLAAADEILD